MDLQLQHRFVIATLNGRDVAGCLRMVVRHGCFDITPGRRLRHLPGLQLCRRTWSGHAFVRNDAPSFWFDGRFYHPDDYPRYVVHTEVLSDDRLVASHQGAPCVPSGGHHVEDVLGRRHNSSPDLELQLLARERELGRGLRRRLRLHGLDRCDRPGQQDDSLYLQQPL